jgi:NADPH-dependent ferric siderophore reductase
MNESQNKRVMLSVEVSQIRELSPHMRRITVSGAALRELDITLPGQWMKVFVPGASDGRPSGRAYTIRGFDRAAGTMDLDFVLHGEEGPASSWAIRAALGERIDIAGPRGGYRIGAASRYTLIGDATALPAIAAIATRLPASTPASALIEVADIHEEQVLAGLAPDRITWLHSGNCLPGTSGQIAAALKDMRLDDAGHRVWVAGESSMVRAVTQYLITVCGLPREAIEAAGYWKEGSANHREKNP